MPPKIRYWHTEKEREWRQDTFIVKFIVAQTYCQELYHVKRTANVLYMQTIKVLTQRQRKKGAKPRHLHCQIHRCPDISLLPRVAPCDTVKVLLIQSVQFSQCSKFPQYQNYKRKIFNLCKVFPPDPNSPSSMVTHSEDCL